MWSLVQEFIRVKGLFFMKKTFVFRVEFFEEDGVYVGLCPHLDVSSFGETLPEAKASLQEAVEAFIEECEAMGTLEAVLEEAGLERHGAKWLPRTRLLEEELAISA